jgi:iron complex transport system ATP-binding protein
VPTALLEIDDASVVMGATRVLDRLSLTIHTGEHTAILGPNGAGKSTLLKLLTMQVHPLVRENGAASIRLFGQERWDVFDLRAQLGIVSADLHDQFVRGNSNGRITGHEAVVSGFFASQGVFQHHTVTAAMRQRATDALARIDAAHLADTPLDAMSTGEARRVLIARALVHQPKALVLDEPTRGLDVVARHAFMERVRALAQQGTTIVLVTHHADEIIPEIDRVILLSKGRVVADGAKARTLTAERLGRVFDAPLTVAEAGGYYHLRITSSS